MKKLIIVLMSMAVLSMVLMTSPVLAGSAKAPQKGTVDPLKLWDPPPPWFYDVVKVIPAQNAPGGQIRVVSDNLSPTVAGGAASGTIVFWCSSTVGFQHDIVITGLNPRMRYSISAETNSFEYSLTPVPGGIPVENFWILPWTYQHITLDLGNFMTDANGLGGAKGTIKLEAGRLYDSTICVYDSNDIKVLEPSLAPDQNGDLAPDTSGFMVY